MSRKFVIQVRNKVENINNCKRIDTSMTSYKKKKKHKPETNHRSLCITKVELKSFREHFKEGSFGSI